MSEEQQVERALRVGAVYGAGAQPIEEEEEDASPVEVTVHVFDEEPCPPHETEPGVCAAHGARVVEVWQ